MKREVRVKTFIKALTVFHTDVKASKNFLNDKRLTQAEKKILECWFLVRDNAIEKILEMLPTIQTGTDLLVESQKNLIWGIALNNKSEYHKAIPLIKSALEIICDYPLKSVEYTAAYNLFVAYLNYKDKKGMKACLDIMKGIHENPRQVTGYLLSVFKYHSFCENFKHAEEALEELEELKDTMSEAFAISYQINKYNYYSRCEKFDQCEQTLQEMKKFRKFQCSSNFTYMRLMLDHIVAKKPLYVYERDFSDRPFLFYQLKIIQLLEENQVGEAAQYWNKLRALAPHTYHENFKYEGDKNIFTLNLQLYQERFTHGTILPKELPNNKEEALLVILKSSKTPLRKEDLFQAIWKVEAQDKADYSKLKMLIARVRQKHDLDIKYKKGCYTLISSENTSKKVA